MYPEPWLELGLRRRQQENAFLPGYWSLHDRSQIRKGWHGWHGDARKNLSGVGPALCIHECVLTVFSCLLMTMSGLAEEKK